MRFLNRLERTLGKYAVENLTIYLVFAQACVLVVTIVRPDIVVRMILVHDQLFAGEWWRLFSMAVIPPIGQNPVFAALGIYMLYLYGTSLETQWGAFRYNIFMLVGYVLTCLAVLIPGAIVTNLFWMGSIFLAFAWLFPDFQILVFFIFPVKVKWLAALAWLVYAAALLDGDNSTRAQIGAVVADFVLFFHRDLIQWARTRQRKIKSEAAQQGKIEQSKTTMHQCTICGITEKSNPRTEFRYCPQCTGTPCYCIEHIKKHVHR